jgi:hypothetical protein
MDWAWGKEAQFRSDIVPQVGLDGALQSTGFTTQLQDDKSSLPYATPLVLTLH